jgi:signal transduction histidine kinase
MSVMAFLGRACFRERRARLQIQRALQESVEERRRFIATISHDFRSPLTAVVGFAQLLCDQEESLDPQRRREYLRVIREQSQRLGRMIEDTVDLSRMAEGRLEINPTDLRLEEVVESALTSLDHPADRDRITLALSPDAPSVWADQYELEQILDRLLHLALTRSAQGAQVTVQAAVSDGIVRITVRADGLDTTGEQFRPLHGDLEAAYTLGKQDQRCLSVATTRALAELQSGSVHAEDDAITLTLPAATADEA